MTAAKFTRDHRLGKKLEKTLITGKNRRRCPPELRTMLLKVFDGKCEHFQHITEGMKNTKSPFRLVENELCAMMKVAGRKCRRHQIMLLK